MAWQYFFEKQLSYLFHVNILETGSNRGPVLLSKWLDRIDAKDGVFRKVAVAQCQSKSLSKTRMKPDRRLRKSRFHVNLVECIIYAAPVQTASAATRLATK